MYLTNMLIGVGGTALFGLVLFAIGWYFSCPPRPKREDTGSLR